MIDHKQRRTQTLFPAGYRASGVLLHLTSLPSPYGIGDMGPAAMEWIDLLADSGQSWWQMLPLGPTGFGNSPYSSASSFAGNWLLISPDALIEDGLLNSSDVAGSSFPELAVDYDAVINFKDQLLEIVWTRFKAKARHSLKPEFETFCSEQAHWLDDYALFEALRVSHGGVPYLSWSRELVQRTPDAMQSARRILADQINKIRLAQFLVFWQGQRMKEHARHRGVQLIGDLPFFVSSDSSDVWANPELFLLDANHRPQFVAGVPPDYFSSDGQLWGNPVYNWEMLRKTGFAWWIARVRALMTQVDLIRLDHFRGFAAAWYVPAGTKTARSGQWIPGPGTDLFKAVLNDLGTLPFIAEDLGLITSDVHDLRDQFQLPGTRVLQFAFDGDSESPHLPHNYVPNSVVYTGTHDNNTTRGWYADISEPQRQFLRNYLDRPELSAADVSAALLRLALKSVAALAITPVQDLLNLGADARMNTPGIAEGNWRLRCSKEMLNSQAFQSLCEMTTMYNRLPVPKQGDSVL
jgi:4-alpha-glucanotransferase